MKMDFIDVRRAYFHADAIRDVYIELPDEDSESSGDALHAQIVDVPFRESVTPNIREVKKEEGLDYAD